MIQNVTRAYDSKTRSALHDPRQPRGSPAIQLSPSPELEPLPTFSSVLSTDGRGPDSMDWEPTEPSTGGVAPRSDWNGDHASIVSVWDRFATAKQRIFARERLTGLERAFESWKDLGTNANTEPPPPPQRLHVTLSDRVSRSQKKTYRPAVFMLASIFRVLSLAVNLPMTSSVSPANMARDDVTWFRIAASVFEAGCAAPQVIQQREWSIQVSCSATLSRARPRRPDSAAFSPTQSIIPMVQTSFAFLYLVARLPVAQIALVGLRRSGRGDQSRIMDCCMALLDLTACCLL